MGNENLHSMAQSRKNAGGFSLPSKDIQSSIISHGTSDGTRIRNRCARRNVARRRKHGTERRI